MDVAAAFVTTQFLACAEMPGLLYCRGDFWEWHADRWQVRRPKTVEDALWHFMENSEAPRIDHRTKQEEVKRLVVNPRTVGDVLRALEARITLPIDVLPAWVGDRGAGPPDLEAVIPFDDVLLDVRTGKTWPRGPQWLDHTIVNVDYQPEAKCPVWDECLVKWSRGDPMWSELLERWLGYCLLPHRKYRKWMLMHGKASAGKSTIANLLTAAMSKGAVCSRTLYQLSDQFGLMGIESTRAIFIHEGGDLDKSRSERSAQTIKSIVGRDHFAIDRKYLPFLESVRLDTAIFMAANQIPRLTNVRAGLSSKMLLLPFLVSFDGKEAAPDFGLEEKLKAELPGILARWASAAGRLENEPDPSKKFVMPAASEEHILAYAIQNNPHDHFLSNCCHPKPGNFVRVELLWSVYTEWCHRIGIKVTIPKNRLLAELESNSTWPVQRHKHGDFWGLTGIALKVEREEWA
jgi:putative DNA primase/helicase